MSVLSAATQQQVEDTLVSSTVIDANELAKAKQTAKEQNTPLFAYLVHEGIISNEALTKTIAQVTKIPYVNLTSAKVEKNILAMLPKDLAERYMAVPLGDVENRLAVAMIDADNVQAVDFLSNKIGRPLKVFVASEEGIREVLKQYEENISAEVASHVDNSGQASDQNQSNVNDKTKNIKTIVQDSPISRTLSTILDYAVRNRASDIHIEPLEKELQIRVRIDGVLRELMKLPKTTEPALVSRIKILSNLKIDEHRIPQDGSFTVDSAGKAIDLRIAISPVVWGEQVVVRLLDKTGTSLKLEDMGYAGPGLRTIRESLKRPNGMILSSGPTGSGKSTSMYALIQEIFSPEINIVTLEDPVEYKIDGVNQIQVNPDVGLTFATGLRSILRQDPDVIMVGEIRDKETAALAVQAALTGHLVFSTLHTNSAAGILPRLLDMGIEPFLIASTVHTVIGQRLVRRIAETGKTAYAADAREAQAINTNLARILPRSPDQVQTVSTSLGYQSLPVLGQNAYTLYKGTDSPDTPSGYKGRAGLYEVFDVSEAIQDLIIKHATSSQIQAAAQKEGMVTMREDGYLKALAGLTTLAEVNRVAAMDGA